MFELSRCCVFHRLVACAEDYYYYYYYYYYYFFFIFLFFYFVRRKVVSSAHNVVRTVVGCFFHRSFFVFKLLEHKNQRGFTKQTMCLKI